jgi:dTDP-4-dehydrorhamnose 3,5-epimerase
MTHPVKDRQTVTSEGEPVARQIEGVVIRRSAPIEDERGEMVEVYRPAWGLHPDPLVYVYQVSLRPRVIKGWVVHQHQDDRLFISRGVIRWALYDNRLESPTHQLLNLFTFSERNRALLIIPRGVFHAAQNVGDTEAVFINMPTQPYDHADPDKYRLPIKNDLIPFDFNDGPGR